MNSSQNNPFNDSFENSEAAIKRDLRLAALDKAFLGAGVVEDLARLSRPVVVGVDVEPLKGEPVVAFDWPLEGSQSVTRSYQLQWLVNHPKVARGSAGGGRRAMLMLGLLLAECGHSLNDVIVIGGGRGQPARLSQIDYMAFDECSPPVDPLSAHPGERHRQLSRKLTSSRSRAGKAARWSS